MVSNQVLQNTIDGIKDITRLEICIMDADGREVVSTAPVFEEASKAIPDFAVSPADSQLPTRMSCSKRESDRSNPLSA